MAAGKGEYLKSAYFQLWTPEKEKGLRTTNGRMDGRTGARTDGPADDWTGRHSDVKSHVHATKTPS